MQILKDLIKIKHNLTILLHCDRLIRKTGKNIMNKQVQEPFRRSSSDYCEKTAIHYQMRDRLVMPIIRELQSNNFPVTSCKKDADSKFTFAGSDGHNRLLETETLELTIENNGSLTLKRFIVKSNRRAPVEKLNVQPDLKNSRKFMNMMRTLAFELARFYNKPAILSHIVYKDDPLGTFKTLANKP